MKKLHCYYAHDMYLYNTQQEKRDIQLLELLGFKVINPNTKKVQEDITNLKKVHGDDFDYMKYFHDIIYNCDVVAFRSIPNGHIPAGVGNEVTYAILEKIPVFELPSSIDARIMSIDFTREYLKEIGQR